jgi:YD repeat-containing protein
MKNKHMPLCLLPLVFVLAQCGAKAPVQQDPAGKDTVITNETGTAPEIDSSRIIIPVPEKEKMAKQNISKRITYYDKELSSTEYFNTDGSTQKLLDAKGKVIWQYRRGKEKPLKEEWRDNRLEHTYDNAGNRIKTVQQSKENGKWTVYSEVFNYYDTENRLDSSVTVYPQKKMTETVHYYYSPVGLEKEEMYTKSEEGYYLSEKTIYIYEDGTLLLKEKKWNSYHPDGSDEFDATVTYSYNEKGDILRKENDGMGITQTYIYEYDENDLLVKETVRGAGTEHVTEYTYVRR